MESLLRSIVLGEEAQSDPRFVDVEKLTRKEGAAPFDWSALVWKKREVKP